MLASIVLSACTGESQLQLDGSYSAESFTDSNGDSQPLTEDSRLQISFDETGMRHSAGCNSTSGSEYELTNSGTLVIDLGFSTAEGCSQTLGEQEIFFAQFLLSEPSVEVDGQTLTLTTNDTTIEFLSMDS